MLAFAVRESKSGSSALVALDTLTPNPGEAPGRHRVRPVEGTVQR